MQQIINDPVQVLEVSLTRVQSQIDSGQIAFQESYSNSDVEALHQELDSSVMSILKPGIMAYSAGEQAGIMTYPAGEQAGKRQAMKEKINAFITFLRSKIVIENTEDTVEDTADD